MTQSESRGEITGWAWGLEQRTTLGATLCMTSELYDSRDDVPARTDTLGRPYGTVAQVRRVASDDFNGGYYYLIIGR